MNIIEIIFLLTSVTIICLQFFTDFFHARRALIFYSSAALAVLGIIIFFAGAQYIVPLHLAKIIAFIFIEIILLIIILVKAIYLRKTFIPPYSLEEIEITAQDGVVLRGDYINNDKDKTIVVFQGIAASTRSDYMVGLVEFLSKDYDVLCLDFRGQGKSGGLLDGTEYLDVLAAAEFLNEKGKTIFASIGISLGAFTSLYANYKYKLFDNMILISSFYGKKIMKLKFSLLNTIFGKIAERIAETRVGNKVNWIAPEEYVDGIHPFNVLVIAGKYDRLFPPREAEALYQKLKGKKEFIVLPGGHSEKMLTTIGPDCYKAIGDWLGKI